MCKILVTTVLPGFGHSCSFSQPKLNRTSESPRLRVKKKTTRENQNLPLILRLLPALALLQEPEH